MNQPERNIRLLVEYRGTAFAGWQIQKEQTTVQGEITAAIERVTGERATVTGAGRTDAGVHALGQVANFAISHRLEPERYAEALNYYLPDDIRVKRSEEVPREFSARFDARFRRYRYLVGRERSAIYRDLRWEHTEPIIFDRLQEAAGMVLGENDFTPFCVVASRLENNHCTIEHSRWYALGPLLIYEIRGNRFLHSMVRSLVGAMINLAAETPDRHPANLTLADFGDIMKIPSETRVPFTAPAHGLYLVSVGY
ncbi:tRNA pseudouridine(38-40) synthase TruA [candidate division GN15 bacterium]|nr:tRNA pseudouridine(38-40) synthase TruA [candidate division GN15 bacterium]